MGEEQRVHARVESDVACEVHGAAGKLSGRLEDLSHGGALLVARRGATAVGEELALVLPSAGAMGGTFVVGARVIWSAVRQDSERFGIEFTRKGPEQALALGTLIGVVLAGRGRGSRAHPRVRHRMEVVCHTSGEFTAVASSLSMGGIGIECDQLLPLESPITVECYLEGVPEPLELAGRVANVAALDDGRARVGVRFDSLDDRRRGALAELLRRIVGAASR